MDTINENRIKGVVSFVIGLAILLLLSSINLLYPYRNLIQFLIDIQWYLFLDLFVLAITLFLYAYFIIKPIKTLKGKKKLVIVARIFGGVLVVFPLIGIVIWSSSFMASYLEGFLALHIIGMLFYLLFLIPGIIFFLYARGLRENLRINF